MVVIQYVDSINRGVKKGDPILIQRNLKVSKSIPDTEIVFVWEICIQNTAIIRSILCRVSTDSKSHQKSYNLRTGWRKKHHVENKIEFAFGFDSDVYETRHTSRQHATPKQATTKRIEKWYMFGWYFETCGANFAFYKTRYECVDNVSKYMPYIITFDCTVSASKQATADACIAN